MDYNLLSKNWIPVIFLDGKMDYIGILKALEHANQIRDIASPNPMDRIAIFRFLLALIYWCKGNPSDEKLKVASNSFPMSWFAKLEDNQSHFNLLGKDYRFYQSKEANRKRPITELLQEVPTGNNFWHFKHATHYRDGFCPSCCIMGLLRLPLFATSGLAGMKSGINGTPPVYIIPK